MSSSSLAFASINHRRINIKIKIRNLLLEQYPDINEFQILDITNKYLKNINEKKKKNLLVKK